MAATSTEASIIEAGNVRFTVEDRRVGSDGGPAICVFSLVDGQDRQLLRFDCFTNDPHYHYDPDGKDEFLHLSSKVDSISWAVDHIEHNLTAMIRLAGYPEVAEHVKGEAIDAAVRQIRAALGT